MKGIQKLKSSFHKIILALLLTPFAALAEWGLNMTQGVTPISKEIYSMHMTSLWVAVSYTHLTLPTNREV